MADVLGMPVTRIPNALLHYLADRVQRMPAADRRAIENEIVRRDPGVVVDPEPSELPRLQHAVLLAVDLYGCTPRKPAARVGKSLPGAKQA